MARPIWQFLIIRNKKKNQWLTSQDMTLKDLTLIQDAVNERITGINNTIASMERLRKLDRKMKNSD